MSLDPDTLIDRLAALLRADLAPSRYLLAYSGGLDSTVLLHALAASRADAEAPLIALHVNHNLQTESAAWETACREFAKSQEVEFHVLSVAVAADSGLGPEAAARQVRYAALRSWMRTGDCLLSAHHEDDQAETLLLNLMRGSGVAGLSGIGAMQAFGPGFLLRPLLDVPQRALLDYAQMHKLEWIEDPSNADSRFDRNFLRNEIIPGLALRWPAAKAGLRRSAEMASEASTLLADLAALDLAECGEPTRLDLGVMRTLSEARQRNLLRYCVKHCELPPAPATRLYQAVQELLPARTDAQPLVCWPGAELRRYRDHLYVLPAMDDDSHDTAALLTADGSALALGGQQGHIRLQESADWGIAPSLALQGLQVRYRRGGESIRPMQRKCSHKLRKLLQEAGVVPWMRQRIPLLYAGDDLVAVADMWVASEHVAEHGYSVCWDDKPALF
jgi:tRNA(Ile)-lysidine synthase